MERSEITFFIIYNPAAGKGALKKQLPKIKKLCEDYGIEALCYGTKAGGDAYRAAIRLAKKYGVLHTGEEFMVSQQLHKYYIISAGGDGTLNETVRGVLDSGYDIPIGILPSGSTNDFGYSLGITGDFLSNTAAMAEAAVKGKVYKCDVSSMDGKYYAYTSSFGLFSDVSYATPRKLKNIFGHAAYIMYGALNLPKTRKIPVTVEYDGASFKADLLLGMIVNAKSVGGFRGITGKNVRLDDGYNEMFIVIWPKGIKGLIKTLIQAVGLKRGSEKALREAENMKDLSGIKIVRIKDASFAFEKEVPFSIDGEYGDMHDLTTFTVSGKRIGYLTGNV